MARTSDVVQAALMSDNGQQLEASEGLRLDDLPFINRTLFDHAVRAAADLHDPAIEPTPFVEALWAELAKVFEWDPRP